MVSLLAYILKQLKKKIRHMIKTVICFHFRCFVKIASGLTLFFNLRLNRPSYLKHDFLCDHILGLHS